MKQSSAFLRLWLGATLLTAGVLSGVPSHAQITIIDQAGRNVRLEQAAQRLFLSEPGDFAMLAALVDNPASRIAAWNRWRLDERTVSHWRSIDPETFDRIEQVVVDGPQNLSAEMLIMHQPDLVVLDHFFGKAAHVISQLERAGIPVAILTLEPKLTDKNPAEGLEKLAVLLGRADRGREVSEFIRMRRDRVVEKTMQLSSIGVAKPTVLMEPHAGIGPCCLSMGIGRSMGDMVVLAGGKLIGSEIIEEMSGRLSPEYIIAQSPEVYIGTGGRHLAGRGGLVLGVDVNPDEARTSLEQVMQRTGLRHIRAMEQGRVHGIWHSGFGIVNLELVASWLYPQHFAEIDPADTQTQFNERFMPFAQEGTFWISLHANED